jgi:hypothetical protein
VIPPFSLRPSISTYFTDYGFQKRRAREGGKKRKIGGPLTSSTVTAPLPPHMPRTFDMFGFDTKRFDPIERRNFRLNKQLGRPPRPDLAG